MRTKLAAVAAFAAVAALAVPAHPAGFHIREQGAKAMGMANAFVAQADDPSAIFYNPAGLAFQEGTKASLGVTIIQVPETEFTGKTWVGDPDLPGSEVSGKQSARPDVFFPPNIYVTHSMKDRPWGFGIGINSLYPLAKRWNTTTAFRDEVKELAIKPINVNPTVSYRYKNFGVAFGIDYTKATLWLENSPYTTVYDGNGDAVNLNVGDLEVEGEGDGWGWNAGFMWRPSETWSFGLSYRSEITLKVDDGDADFLVSQQAQDLLGLPSHVNTGGATEITLPDTLSLAVAWKPTSALTLEFDVDRFGWSSYDELTLEFDDNPVLSDTTDPKDWEDTWTYRLGVQYALTDYFDIRGGYAYDNTPVPDETLGPELPDADRHNLTLGFGFHSDRGAVDFAYMAVLFKDRSVSNEKQDGEYKSQAHLFGLNVTYNF